MKNKLQRQAARNFADDWKDRGYEKGESHKFWLALLRDVLGVKQPEKLIEFEKPVRLDHTSFIDGHIPSTHVLIEQKSAKKDLRQPIRQSNGQMLTPFQQVKRYAMELRRSEHPRWVVTCNFRQFLVYDMEKPQDEPEEILLENLPDEYWRLRFLVDDADSHVQREKEASLQAGEIVARLYDALLSQYLRPDEPQSRASLNVLCMRLVFCLYAEDAGVLGRHGAFHDYLAQFTPERMREALISLFNVLNTPEAGRDPYLEDALAAFPYVNGGLFADEGIEIPRLNAEIAHLLLQHASQDFDWSHISPTIFGALFESTINPETRRSGGMHYTSIENIHKVIDPLFLDDLRAELRQIKALKIEKLHTHRFRPNRTEEPRTRRLRAFQQKLATLRFLDPACGSGNFLTETYLSLRRLENECLRLLHGAGQKSMPGDFSPIQVSIGQFYGIEVNGFAVAVARTALWIAEAQMMAETEDIVQRDLNFLPLKSYPNIVEGNALRMDWNTVCPHEQMYYIIGNPPFVGARIMQAGQKTDLKAACGEEWKGLGNMDYVCGWYKKAADYMRGTAMRAALVSSNSVTQGEQVALIWKPLMEQGVGIDFAWRTFRWNNEATDQAHVHCVIIGFSIGGSGRKLLFTDAKSDPLKVEHINAYLLPMKDVFISSRPRPLCDVPPIGIGNQPIDDGNYLFRPDEKEAFLRKEPAAAPYFRPWFGADEFINNRPRYCLWLGDCTPAQLRRMPHCLKRVEAVRSYRLNSTRKSTIKLADTPRRFQTENMPQDNYLLIPRISSERRRYVPIGFMTADAIASDAALIIPHATLYHFGMLTSSAHMAWMRTVCGRLKSDYRYSKDIVYNNFPWPAPTPKQKEEIERTARAILNARALYPDSSLADLYYKDVTMPPELRSAHQANDRAVLKAYGWAPKLAEEDVITRLLTRYEELALRPAPTPMPAAVR